MASSLATRIPTAINRILLKCIHLLITMLFWTTGFINSLLSTVFNLTMGAMLKGSDISDIHNLTQSAPRHVAVIASDDWAQQALAATDPQIHLIQIVAWLIFSGVAIVTLYDQRGALHLHKSEIEKVLIQKMGVSLEQLNRVEIFVEENGRGRYPKLLECAITAPLNGMQTYKRIDHIMGNNEGRLEPELVVVLDPQNKKSIFEFNPWTIRLSEFVFFNKLRLSQADVLHSFQKFIKIEKRFGK